jgi:hypothetical protein
MNTNFTIEFGNKNALIKFSEDENARTYTFGEFGRTGEASELTQALIHVMANTYPISGPGIYMHTSFESAKNELKNDNVGYIDASNLRQLVELGTIKARREDFSTETWFRVHADMGKFWTEELKWVEKQEGEPKFVEHNRNALALLPYLERIRFAQEKGVNVRILYSGKVEFKLDQLKEAYNLHVNGQPEEIKAILSRAGATNETKRQVQNFEKLAKKAAEEGVELVTTKVSSQDLSTAMGKTIRFIAKNGVDLFANNGSVLLRTVNTETFENLKTMIAQLSLTWAVADIPVVTGRNVPEKIEE